MKSPDNCPICGSELILDFPDYFEDTFFKKCFVARNHSVYFYLLMNANNEILTSVEVSDLNDFSFIFDFADKEVRVLKWKNISNYSFINYKSFNMPWFEPIFDFEELSKKIDVFSTFM